MMKVTILGSGTCVPSLKRNAPGYLLEINDKKILVDCGPGTLLQLEKIRTGLYKEIDYVFLTHTHADHISDLPFFIQALIHASVILEERKKMLVIVGPPDFKDFYERVITKIERKPTKDEFPLIVTEYNGLKEFNGFSVDTIKTFHTDNSSALKFKAENKTIVFSGDLGYDEKFIEFAKESDILLLECTLKNNVLVEGHLNPQQCANIANKVHCKKLLLTHIHPSENLDKECLKIIKENYDGDVNLAEDLMELKP